MRILNPQRWLFEWRYWCGRSPWDTGITPPEVMGFLENIPAGWALDLGCGTGTNAITLARHGWQVTGMDFSPRAIRTARSKAARAGLEIDFRVGDVSNLTDLTGPYDFAFDIGCLHSLEPEQRPVYAAGPEQIEGHFSPHFQVTRTIIGEENSRGSAWHWLKRT